MYVRVLDRETALKHEVANGCTKKNIGILKQGRSLTDSLTSNIRSEYNFAKFSFAGNDGNQNSVTVLNRHGRDYNQDLERLLSPWARKMFEGQMAQFCPALKRNDLCPKLKGTVC